MSVASIEKKLDDIDVVLVEDDFSSAEEKEGKTLSLLENCCVCYTPLHQSRFPQLFPCLHSACSTCLSKQHVEENNLKSVGKLKWFVNSNCRTEVTFRITCFLNVSFHKECPSCKKLFPITEITENIIFKQSLPLSGGSDVFMVSVTFLWSYNQFTTMSIWSPCNMTSGIHLFDPCPNRCLIICQSLLFNLMQ